MGYFLQTAFIAAFGAAGGASGAEFGGGAGTVECEGADAGKCECGVV